MRVIMREYAMFLKELRICRNLTQREVGRRTNLSNSYISQMEKGMPFTPSLKTLSKLARVYDVEVTELVSRAQREKKALLESRLPLTTETFLLNSCSQLTSDNRDYVVNFVRFLLHEQNKKSKLDRGETYGVSL